MLFRSQPARAAATPSSKAGSAPQKNVQSTQTKQAAPVPNTVRFVPPTQPVAPAPPPKPRVQGELCHNYTHASQKIHALAWSPDGGSLAAAGEEPEQIYVWQALTQQAVSAYKVHARLIQALAWSPDSQLLVSGGNDRVARVWQPGKSAQQTYSGHTGWVQALAWSPEIGRAHV